MAGFLEEAGRWSKLEMADGKTSTLDRQAGTEQESRSKVNIAVHVWTLMMVESTGIGIQQGTD